MTRSSPILRTSILGVLALAVTTSAQLTDLPDLGTQTDVLGATSAPSNSATSATDSSSSGAIQTATTTASSAGGLLTNAPTIYGVGVPPLIVPDTSGAPFMHKSDLPEGFVFIAVGAILAFLGLCVLAWRGLVAWSLHRSVKRTASDRFMSEKKSSYGASTNYSSVYHSADVSLEHLTTKDTAYKERGGQHRRSRSHSKPQRTSRQPPSSSLFFSPTSGAGQGAANRISSYLPAGYYASSGSNPAAGSSIANFGGPPAAGYGRLDANTSPPTTPGPRARSGPQSRPQSGYERRYDRSTSHDRLDVPRREHRRKGNNLRNSTNESIARAPSAMLDDLFDNHSGRS